MTEQARMRLVLRRRCYYCRWSIEAHHPDCVALRPGPIAAFDWTDGLAQMCADAGAAEGHY